VTEGIAVEARFEQDGTIRVLAFERRGSRHVVASMGRQWDAEDGRHFLVMTPSEMVVELLYRQEAVGGAWELVRDFRRGSETA
jgi:hypothetical protein